MLTVRVGKIKMARRQHFKGWLLKCMLVLVPLVVFITLVLQKFSNPFKEDWRRSADFDMSSLISKAPSILSDGSAAMKIDCAEDHFSFFMHSGAANVVPPKIYIQNNLVLGAALNNAGYGINIVVMNGRTGEVIKTGHFDMYSGDVNPLIDLLQSIEIGSVVLVASYDEPSSKLNKDARKLIAGLGSSAVQSLGFRDNWVFVGGKGAAVKSNFEKILQRTRNTHDLFPPEHFSRRTPNLVSNWLRKPPMNMKKMRRSSDWLPQGLKSAGNKEQEESNWRRDK